jgi:hypothetical protein
VAASDAETEARGGAETEARGGDWIEIIDVDGTEACYGVSAGKPFAESPWGASG